MPRPSRRLLPALLGGCLLAGVLTGCGGADDAAGLSETCSAVRRAFPPTLYDDAANARFARRLDSILDGADAEARSAFGPLVRRLRAVVDAAGDNEAVVTANVELLGALQDVNRRCQDAGAQPVHPMS